MTLYQLELTVLISVTSLPLASLVIASAEEDAPLRTTIASPLSVTSQTDLP